MDQIRDMHPRPNPPGRHYGSRISGLLDHGFAVLPDHGFAVLLDHGFAVLPDHGFAVYPDHGFAVLPDYRINFAGSQKRDSLVIINIIISPP